MPLPSLSARTLIWDLSRKNVQHLPNSPTPPVFWAEDRSPFLCKHSGRRKSMQNCRLPSFFCTNTTALHQALWLGLIAPDSNISCRWFWTSSTNGGGIHLNHSLKGVSSITFILCSMEWVQPNSTGSNENTSWYLARSCAGSICQLGGPGVQATQVQFIEQFTMSLPNGQSGGMGILGLISPLQQLDFFRGFRHRQCCYCTLATRVFFWRVCE